MDWIPALTTIPLAVRLSNPHRVALGDARTIVHEGAGIGLPVSHKKQVDVGIDHAAEPDDVFARGPLNAR